MIGGEFCYQPGSDVFSFVHDDEFCFMPDGDNYFMFVGGDELFLCLMIRLVLCLISVGLFRVC